MKPATSYVFLVRAENTYGLSVPSPLSSMVRTQGSDHGYVPHSELVAARSVLASKVSVYNSESFLFYGLWEIPG